MLPLLIATALANPTVPVGDAEGLVMDGVVDEPAWLTVAPTTDFLRFQPTEGGPPPGTTEVRFLQDARYLYASVRVTGADYALRARISPREDINEDDQIGIYLDTFRDQRSGYIFYLNAIGVQQDFRRNGDTVTFSWDAVFQSAGRLTDDGYELEIAWPWRSLKYASGASEWGVLLTRKIPHDNAKYGFPVMVRGNPQLFTQAATLTGLRPPKSGTGLELLPQLTLAQAATRTDGDLNYRPWTPIFDVVQPSLDARLGLTANLGLAATVNPDFSQVEFDVTPTALNQRFAFFFQERRPFFLDGAEYFKDPAAAFYSRSIVQPLGGLKLSGRGGPWQVGALTALDRSPAGSIHERATPGFNDVDGALAATTFLRATHDVGSTGTVGAVVADKRLWRGGAPLGEHTLSSADANLFFGDRWRLTAASTHSWTGRPGGEVLWGMGNQLSVQRAFGVGTGFSATLADTTPGLRKETGFMPQSGLTHGSVAVDHTFEPKGVVSTVAPWASVEALHERNGEGFRSAGTGVDVVLNGVHALNVGGELGDRRELDAETTQWVVWAEGATQVGSVLTVAAESAIGRELDFDTLGPANTADYDLTLVLRPTAGVRLDLNGHLAQFRPLTEDQTEQRTRVRARMAWQFSRPLGLRVLAEHNAGNTRTPALLSSVLLTWLKSPGTALWLGYSEVTELDGTPKASSRAIFGKVSVLIRP